MGAEVWILLAASGLALQIVTVVMRREHKAELPYLALVAVDLGGVGVRVGARTASRRSPAWWQRRWRA